MKHLNILFRAWWGLFFLSLFFCRQTSGNQADAPPQQPADRLYDEGRLDEALPLYEKTYREAMAGNRWEAVVNAGLRICAIHAESGAGAGDLTRLKTMLDLTLLHMPNEHYLLGECCNAIGQWYFDKGEPDSAKNWFSEAGQHYRQLDDWNNWGNAQTGLAACCYSTEQYRAMDSVLRETERAVKGRIKPDEEFWGAMFNLRGVYYNATGRYREGLENSLQEIAFYQHRQDFASLAIAYNNIGDLYQQRGDYDRALQYFRAYLQLVREAPHSGAEDLCNAYLNLSETWYRKKNYDQALAFARQAQQALKDLSPGAAPGEFIRLYNGLAAALIEKKDYQLALGALQKALPLHDLLPAQKGVETTWHNLSNVYRMLRQYPIAEHYLQKAVARYSAILGKRNPELGKACRHLGYIREVQDDLPGALAQYQRALAILVGPFHEIDPHANPVLEHVESNLDVLRTFSDKGRVLQQLAAAQHQPGALEAALSAYQLAIDLLDSMRNEYQEGSVQFWSDDARPIFERAIGVAYHLYRQTGQFRYLESAFRYAEKSKAVLLSGALQESAARRHAGIPTDLLDKEKEYKIEIAFYQKLIFQEQHGNAAPDQDKILLWQRAILDSRRGYEQLLAQLKTSYPAYFQAKYAGGLTGVGQLQQALAPQTTLVEYFLGDDQIFAFCIDRERASFAALEKTADFMPRLEAFVRELRDRDKIIEAGLDTSVVRTFALAASRFYRQLLGPMFEAPPPRLVLITDGALGYLPFELLLTSPYTGGPEAMQYDTLSYLLKKCTVRYEYSAAIAVQPAAADQSEYAFGGFAPRYDPAAEATNRGFAVNCETPEPGQFPPLLKNLEEVSDIARLLHGRPFLEKESTEATFKSEASRFGILHLAMHGFINDCDPSYSGLVFSRDADAVNPAALPAGSSTEENDGFLFAYEIYNMHLKADLAVLSACNTGIGQLARGEGIMSLARAFKYAGCPNILMSLWQADDQATSAIMLRFYELLQQGLNKDEALRQAKLDYLRNNNRNHPFFWGAFVLVGNDRPVITRRPVWLYITAGLLLAAGVAMWLFYRVAPKKTNRR